MFPPCIILVLSTPVLSQYMPGGDGFRADITFDDHNDRFDVADIIGEQNRQFQELPADEDDFRRAGDEEPLVEILKKKRLEALKAKEVKTLRRTGDFDYFDRMDTSEQGHDSFDRARRRLEINSYEQKLANFRAKHRAKHGRRGLQVIDLNNYIKRYNPRGNSIKSIKKDKYPWKRARRAGGPLEEGFQMDHGFPVNMKVTGYIELPR